MNEPQLVRDQLDDVAGPEFTTVDDPAEVVKDGTGAGDVGVTPADEQGQPSMSGTVDGAGDR